MSGQGTASAGGLFERLSRYVDVLRGSDLDVVDYRPDEHPRLVAFDGLDGYEEVDRYWLDAPFAFASINYDDEEKHHLYHVVEPSLTLLEVELLEALYEDIRAPLLYDREIGDDPEAVLRDELRARLEEYGGRVGLDSFYRLFYYLYRQFRGFGPIDAVLIPNLPEAPSADGYSVGGFLQMGSTDTDGYRLAFFHAALIQSTLSGLVGGQMGDGSVRDGVKHATIMLGMTYVVFLALQSVSVFG